MKFVPKSLDETADISRGDQTWNTFLKNAAAIVLAIVALYVLLGASASLVASQIPERWEAKWFSWNLPDLDLDGDGRRRTEAILERLTVGESLRPLPYRIVILPGLEPNAFALPGGTIGVTQGLLDTVESDTGLAFVIGHELGHHHHRHTLKRIGRSLVFQTAIAVLFGADPQSVVGASLALAESGHSRRQEREADAFGAALARKHYENDGSILEFFEDLESGAARDEADWAAFLSTHPMTKERLAELRALLEE